MPTNALNPARPTLADNAGELPETLRNIKAELVDNAAAALANTNLLATKGNFFTRNVTVSTSTPDDATGVDGDLWIQIES